MKKLDRTIGLASVIAISLSTMLGAGMFVLPGLAVEKTGASVWLAFILAAFCVLPAAVCKAELATAMPTSGGTYIYLFRVFGPLAGTVAGIGLWMSLLLKSAVALVGFSAYLTVLAPNVPIVPTALCLLVAVTLMNVAGIAKLSKAQIVVTSMAIAGLILFMIAGVDDYEAAHFEPLFPTGGAGFVETAAFVFVSYAGVTKIAALAGEVKRPEKNLPRGIFLTLIISALLYGTVTFALVAVVPPDLLRGDLHPIYLLADAVGGYWLGIVASVGAIVMMTASAAAGLLASSRFPFAMSRDSLLPSALGRLSETGKTPVIAILATAAVMAVSILTLDVMKIAKLASAFKILIFISVNLAVVVLRESRAAWYKPKYRAPLYPAMPIFGIVSGLVLVVLLGLMAFIGALVFAAFGAVLYFLYSRSRTEHLGVVGKIGRREDLAQSQRPLVEIREHVESDANVVVALFGNERSPEMLVDLGVALTDDGKIHATHLTEVDEAELEELIDEQDVAVESLRRRVRALAEESGADVEFQAIMSRDLVHSVHAITSRAHCEWLVMQWHGRPRRSLTSLTPIGWLINHLPANLAMFKDAGVRYVRKILVLPAPGPHDALVVRTADHLACKWKADLTLARFVADVRPEADATAQKDYLSQLARLCAATTEERIVRGKNHVTAVSATTSAFDLVVMAAPQLSLRNLVMPNVEDQIIKGAACSVLRLRTPRGQTHQAFSRRPEKHLSERAHINDFLTQSCVSAQLDLSQKSALMSHFARTFADELGDVEFKVIHDAFLAREREQNTGVGSGVALPHSTVAEANRALVGVFITREPVVYDAIDGKPVDVFFATLCPPSARQQHLQLLSDIARLTLKTDVLVRLREATKDHQVIDAINECTRELDDKLRSPSRRS